MSMLIMGEHRLLRFLALWNYFWHRTISGWKFQNANPTVFIRCQPNAMRTLPTIVNYNFIRHKAISVLCGKGQGHWVSCLADHVFLTEVVNNISKNFALLARFFMANNNNWVLRILWSVYIGLSMKPTFIFYTGRNSVKYFGANNEVQ